MSDNRCGHLESTPQYLSQPLKVVLVPGCDEVVAAVP